MAWSITNAVLLIAAFLLPLVLVPVLLWWRRRHDADAEARRRYRSG